MEGGREGSGPGGEDEGHVAYGKSVYIIYIPRISTSSETGLASKNVLRNMTNDVSVGRGRF